MENHERRPSAHTSSQSQASVVVPCVNEEEQSNTTIPFRGPNHVATAEDFRLNGDVQSGLDYFSPFYMPAVSWHLANPEPASSGNEQEIRSSPFSLVDNASMPLVQGPVDEPSLSTWPSTLEPFSLLARYNEIVNTITGFPFIPSLGGDSLRSFPLNIDQTQSQQYMCRHPSCNGRIFARRGDLRRHERIHQNHRPYPCNWIGCNRTGQNGFTRRDKLAEHERNVHGIDRRAINGVWF